MVTDDIDDANPDQPWRWWPSWTSRPERVSFIGSTDRFDVFYDSKGNDYSLVYETDPPVPGDMDGHVNFFLVYVDENAVIDLGRHPPEDLDPYNMCQLYHLVQLHRDGSLNDD
jgi:hypothetical protein